MVKIDFPLAVWYIIFNYPFGYFLLCLLKKIKRFIDFAKFIAFLEDQALFFCRSDRLGDNFEGHYSYVPLKANVTYVSANSAPRSYNNVELDKNDASFIKEHNIELRKRVFINCWIVNKYESYSLWKLYSSKKGIAIQSTVGKLKESLKPTSHPINIGPVSYIDWDVDAITVSNSLSLFVHKRKNFESENELRALYWDIDGKHSNEFGVNVKIEPEILVENIYIYPMSSQWHYDLVKSILKRYNFDINVRTSKLSEKPE